MAGCVDGSTPPLDETPPPPKQPTDADFAAAIRPGDLVALVPGTGAYDYLAASIEPLAPAGTDDPLVDVTKNSVVADDAIVFEQAIAAAHRAGISDADLEAGAVTFGLWGAGFTRLTGFDYVSYEGLKIRITILGGKQSCAVGTVDDNLLNYTQDHADSDATDLYVKIQAWLAAHPVIGAPRNVVVASHSWGGAIAEYLAFHAVAIELRNGPLSDATGVAPMALTVAMGVPAWVPGYAFAGPTYRTLTEGRLYEVDRPDDPVHAMNPSGNPDGHQYDILFGDAFQGSYGITTEALSCRGVAGACKLPSSS